VLQTVSWIAISLGVLTALVIAADERSHPQGMQIMSVVWPVTGLYFPVIGGWLYRAVGRPLVTHAHHAAAQEARWKSVLLSATHCGAGCVIGDIVAVALFGPNFAIEFALAYLFGIAFQYIPIRAMRDISPATALWEAVKADTLSLVAFEVGMFGWMAVAILAAARGGRAKLNRILVHDADWNDRRFRHDLSGELAARQMGRQERHVKPYGLTGRRPR